MLIPGPVRPLDHAVNTKSFASFKISNPLRNVRQIAAFGWNGMQLINHQVSILNAPTVTQQIHYTLIMIYITTIAQVLSSIFSNSFMHSSTRQPCVNLKATQLVPLSSLNPSSCNRLNWLRASSRYPWCTSAGIKAVQEMRVRSVI